MSAAGLDLALAAAALVDVPFRLHGRDPATGLDCVGLVTAALAAIGRPAPLPTAYRLRQISIEAFLPLAQASGLRPATGSLRPGDIVLAYVGPAQHHMLLASSTGGFVHAHAALRRVVHTPAPLTWPALCRWRLD